MNVYKITQRGVRASLEEIGFEQPALTLDDASRLLPAGAYTTLRTYRGNCAIQLEKHFDRLEETARLSGCLFHLERDALRAGMREAIQISSQDDSRIRITVDFSLLPGNVFLSIEPLQTPSSESYRNGVDVVTRSIVRENPRAKLTQFISIARQVRQEFKERHEEILLVDQKGDILEGLTSNFFAVLGNRLRTAGEGILMGLTRSIVLECAATMELSLDFTPVPTTEIKNTSEAFITSSSRGILPLRSIDGKKIGTEIPGVRTRALAEKFETSIAAMIRPI
ncbi:MAG: aminotransferase class IV [Anaerolineaceae bacterium]|nr:aminotransferase class IV [Anaerolineaceae bacterium]